MTKVIFGHRTLCGFARRAADQRSRRYAQAHCSRALAFRRRANAKQSPPKNQATANGKKIAARRGTG